MTELIEQFWDIPLYIILLIAFWGITQKKPGYMRLSGIVSLAIAIGCFLSEKYGICGFNVVTGLMFVVAKDEYLENK